MHFPDLSASLAASTPSAAEIAANPIWRLLADAGIDWTLGVAEVEARQGKRFDHASQSWQLVYPSDHPAFDRMLHPVSARMSERNHPLCPPGHLHGFYYAGDDVRENVRIAVAQLSPYLGEGEPHGIGEPHGASNIVGRRWKCGQTTLRVYGFPPERNAGYGRNLHHERDPRLKAATTLAISSGFRLVLAEQERAIVEGAAAMWPYPPTRASTGMIVPDEGSAFPYHRYSEDAYQMLAEALCLSADGNVIIAGAPQQFVLIERSALQSVTVDRMSKARGGAFSCITLNMTDSLGYEGRTRITIMTSNDTEGCTDGGQQLAEMLGVKYMLSPVYPNA